MDQPTDDDIRRLGTIAHGIAFRLLGSRQDAEDVAQEAVTRTAIRWRRVHGHAEAFTSRVATNLAIGLLRKRRTLPVDVAPDETGTVHSADHVDLVHALGRLSARQREVLVLRFVGDYSERDIAASLGCSPGSVKRHSARGLAALRRALPADTVIEGMLDA